VGNNFAAIFSNGIATIDQGTQKGIALATYQPRFRGIFTMRTTGTFARRGMLLATLALAVAAWGWSTEAGQKSRFDKLTEEDRQAFSQRFEKEIWPLLSRNGKDGCVGCHSSGKIVSTLKYKDTNPDKVFRMLLKDGYLLPQDEGSVLYMVSSKNVKERMPKGQPPWTTGEIATLKKFVVDLDKKQQK
jgi:hypothetical protein